MNFIFLFTQTLLIFTVFGQIIAVILIASFFIKQKNVLNFFAKNALLFAFIITLVATIGSLIYSEVLGYEPCKLCWFQRILMYPQVIILGMALLKKDFSVAIYSIVLSLAGAVIAGYHYLLQIGVASSANCSAVGYSINCAQRFVMGFGYITIPMMAFTAFILVIIFMATLKLKSLSKKI